MCDKKNSVLFNDTECIVLSLNFKLTDESHVLLKVPRKNNMYSCDLKNIVPKGGLTCLLVKATSDESELWHRRLGHINFKTMNKLVKRNLVRGLPSKLFEIHQTVLLVKRESNIELLVNPKLPMKDSLLGIGPNWLFDIDALTKSMNYKPVVIGNQSNGNAGTKACDDACKDRMETVPGKDYILLPLWTADSPFSQSSKSSPDAGFKPSGDDEKKVTKEPREEGDDSINAVGGKTSIELPDDPNMPELEDIVYLDDDEDVGAEADINNLDAIMLVSPIPTTRVHKDHPVEQIIRDLNSAPQTRRMIKNLEEHDEKGIVIKNKSRLVAQGYTQEEGIDYDKAFLPVARIEAIRLFLAYASFKDFMVYQMDVKSAFLYGKIEKEVYVCQPPGFEDPNFPDRVYKVEKALYGLHQAPKAWHNLLLLLEVNAARHKLLLLLVVNVARHKLTTAIGSTDCLPNATIYEELTRMGILQSLSAKTTAWNEFSSTMASAIIGLATNQKFNFSKYIFESMVKNLDNAGKFLMYPRFVQVFLDKQLEGMQIHKRIYVTPSHTKKIFGNMRRVGKGFSRRDTPLFPIMMIQAQQEQCEGSEMPTDPHHTPTIIQPSTSQPQKKQRPRRPKRKDSEVPQPSGPTTNVADKSVNEEMDDSSGPRHQDNLGDTIARTRFENVFKTSNDSLLVGEDASKQGRKIDDIDKDAEYTLVHETQGRYSDEEMFDTCVLDDDEVLAEAEVTIKDVNLIEEEEEEERLAREKGQREEEANIVTWDNVQAMIDVDYQMAQQMQAEEQEKLSIEEKSKLFVQLLEARNKHFAVMRAQEMRNKPPTKAQKRNTMSTYLKNMVGYKNNQLKNKSFNDIQKLFDKSMKRVTTFVDMDTQLMEGNEVLKSSSKRAGIELEQESIKKQKLEEDKETTELQRLIEVVPNKEEVAIDVFPLASKPPSIVDYKIYKEGNKTYYQIIRVDGSLKMYLVFSHMLKNFDREDLETLCKLVKAKNGSTRPEEGYERVL
ncbi:ribonuclease H-like domain-containing protein [Tanacetum coccineum]